MGKNNIITHICAKYFKSTQSVSIILIRVIRIDNCKVCKSSSVRGDPRPLWCIILDGRARVYAKKKKKKKSKNQEKYKKMRKRKVEKKHTDYHPVPFMFIYVFVILFLA